jgi:hypothetical protein
LPKFSFSTGTPSENGVPIDDWMLGPDATSAQITGKWANFIRISGKIKRRTLPKLCAALRTATALLSGKRPFAAMLLRVSEGITAVFAKGTMIAIAAR